MTGNNKKGNEHPDEEGISLPGENRDPDMRKDAPPELGKEEIRSVKQDTTHKNSPDSSNTKESRKNENL